MSVVNSPTNLRFQKWLTANQVAVAAPSVVSAVKPANTIIVDGYHGLRIIPFGAGADTNVFVLTFHTVDELEPGAWVTHPLIGVTCTLTTAVGVGPLAPTDRFCDTLVTVALGVTHIGAKMEGFMLRPAWTPTISDLTAAKFYSPADNSIGELLLFTEGMSELYVEIALTSATNANFFYKPV